MSIQVDIYKTKLAMRHTLLSSEVARLSGTNELVGIRAGDFSTGDYIRDTGAPLPIVSGYPDAQQLNDNMSVYDPESLGLNMYVTESFLPVFQGRVANERAGLEGIMQYDVNVKSAKNSGVTNEKLLWDTVKYISEVFDPEQPYISVDQYQNMGIAVDETTPGPILIDDGWVKVPLSIYVRSYVDSQSTALSGLSPDVNVPIAVVLDVGEHIIDTIQNDVYQGVIWDYSVLRTTNARTGAIMGAWDTTQVEYNESTTLDVGDTGTITFEVRNVAGAIQLVATVSSGTYSVKLVRRPI